MTSQRTRIANLCLILLLGVAAAVFVYRGPMRAIHGSDDFAVFYNCARVWLHGQNPYDAVSLYAEGSRASGLPSELLGNSISPPSTFVLMAPFGLLNWPAARAAWLAIGLLSVGLVFVGLLRLIGPGLTRTQTLVLAFLTLGLASVQTSVGVGQLVLPTVALVVWGIVALRRDRGLLAGTLFAVAAAAKPQIGGLYLAYLLLRGRWRPFLTGAGVGLLILGVGILRMELAGVHWLTTMQASYAAFFHGGDGDLAGPFRVQLLQLPYPLFVLLGSPHAASVVAYAVTAVLGAILLCCVRRIRTDNQELLSFGIISILSLLPVYHRYYDAVVLLIPVAWALAASHSRTGPHARLTLLLALPFLLPGGPLLQELGRRGYVSTSVVGSWWWQGIVVPHQTWLMLGLAMVLTAALVRTIRLSKEQQSAMPAASAGSLGGTTGPSC